MSILDSAISAVICRIEIGFLQMANTKTSQLGKLEKSGKSLVYRFALVFSGGLDSNKDRFLVSSVVTTDLLITIITMSSVKFKKGWKII